MSAAGTDPATGGTGRHRVQVKHGPGVAAADSAAIPAPRSAPSALEHATGPMLVPDAALAAAAATNSAAFAAVYRRYGQDLYGFCLGMLRDPDAAADCMHDVFVIAATRLSQLREQDKLRPWLYAIARHEALKRLKRRRREEPADQIPDTPDPGTGEDLGQDLARRELVDLVNAAFDGLPDQDRAIFELHYRRGLNGPALADALGLSATNANTRVGRMRTTVEKSLGALLVARHHRDRCPELAGVLAGWDGTLTVLMRKRIAGHIERCATCTRSRNELVDPRALLASAPAVVPVPDWLTERVLTDTAPIVDAATPPAALAAGTTATVAAKGGSWWPAGLGVSTKTIVAVAAPFVAAAVAVPLALLALSGAATPPTEPVVAAAPVLVDPVPTTSSRGQFTLDTSTTRYARPTAEASTSPAAPTQRPASSVPTTLGGAVRPAPGGAGDTPTASAQRKNGIGRPIIPRKNTRTDPPSLTTPPLTRPPETSTPPAPNG